ncbi:MAG: hypothetical protein WC695_06700 [Candidatus Omnitrophota bacterium]
MDKETAYLEFFKSLKVAFNNASAYFQEHPYYIKSVEALKGKIEELLNYANPIKVNFSDTSVFVEGLIITYAALSNEITLVFHARKIQGLEIRPGVTLEELIVFLSKMAMSARDIIRSGGLQNILDQEKISHVLVEELDFSQLLKSEGEECKDIWIYLFRDAMNKRDPQKIANAANNFERIVGKFKVKDLFEDTALNKNVKEFFGYIKENDKEGNRFAGCSKGLLKLILNDKEVTKKYSADEIKALFKDLSESNLADALWDQMTSDHSFDAMSFQLFSQLVNNSKHAEVAAVIEQKAKNVDALKGNVRLRNKIKALFSTEENQYIPEVYRHALSVVLENTMRDKEFRLEQDTLNTHYRLILLNLLTSEADVKKLQLILEKIANEFELSVKANEWEYISSILEVLVEKEKTGPFWVPESEMLRKRIMHSVENIVFQENVPTDFDYLIPFIRESVMNSPFYLDKMFKEGLINAYVLRFFLKFFPDQLPHFYEELDKKAADLEVIGKVVEALVFVQSPLAQEILKYIFSKSNALMKSEALQALGRLPVFDKEYFFSILEGQDILLKKEALQILLKDPATAKKALDKIFVFPHFWGKENKTVMESLILIEELDIREAKGYLAFLGKRWVWGGSGIRKKTRELLKRWQRE